MKSKSSTPATTSAVVAFALCLAPLVQAQSTRTSDQPATSDRSTQSSTQMRSSNTQNEQMRSTSGQHAMNKQLAEDVIGKQVRGSAGAELGEVSDLVIDTQSGKIVYGLVSSGGFLGFGDTLRAVPFQAFKRGAGDEAQQLSLNMDNAKWKSAPTARQDEIAQLSVENRGREIHEYYGETWSAVGQQLSSAAASVGAAITGNQQRSGQPQLMLSSNIKGKNIRSGQETVGEVENIVIDFQNRTASALVDVDDDFAGSDQKFVIGFDRLQSAVGEDADFTTTLSRQDFQGATSTTGVSAGAGASLYVWQDRTTGTTATTYTSDRDSDRNQAQTQQYGQNNQGQSMQASTQVQAVRNALQADAGLGQSARQVNVMAQDDKIVLRGTVASQQEKQQIERKAREVSQGVTIENEINVRSTAE